MPAVEHGDGEQIENGEVDRKERHEAQQGYQALCGHLSRDLPDEDRATQLPRRNAPANQAIQHGEDEPRVGLQATPPFTNPLDEPDVNHPKLRINTKLADLFFFAGGGIHPRDWPRRGRQKYFHGVAQYDEVDGVVRAALHHHNHGLPIPDGLTVCTNHEVPDGKPRFIGRRRHRNISNACLTLGHQ